MLDKLDQPVEAFQENGQWYFWTICGYKEGPFPDLESTKRGISVYQICELDGPPPETMAEAKRMQLYFPFRIVFVWFDDLGDQQWRVEAAYSKRRAMALRRKGYGVMILEKE